MAKKKTQLEAHPKYFTVDPPDGIRLYIGKGFCTTNIPKGRTLTLKSIAAAKPINGNKSVSFAELECLEDHKMYRVEWSKFLSYKEQGILRE